jgi:transcriptional regulator with XRE-family HTH domain
MDPGELKLTSASNIINLRTAAGLTQAELGAKLNYSDKTISKWERGEAIPDAYVLTQLAEIFGVTVDYLLSSHDKWVPPEQEEEAPQYSRGMIYAVAILSVWTMALIAFVVLWLVGIIWWPVFAVALTASALVYLILSVIFKRTRNLQYILAGLVLSVFILLYVLTLPLGNHWQLFLILIPAEALVFLACNIKKKPKKRKPQSVEK